MIAQLDLFADLAPAPEAPASTTQAPDRLAELFHVAQVADAPRLGSPQRVHLRGHAPAVRRSGAGAREARAGRSADEDAAAGYVVWGCQTLGCNRIWPNCASNEESSGLQAYTPIPTVDPSGSTAAMALISISPPGTPMPATSAAVTTSLTADWIKGRMLRPRLGKPRELIGAAIYLASDAGAPSIGFNITLPHEQEPNPYSTPDLTFRFHYFAMRKMHFAIRAAALVVFPGGFGTMDELFEILTLQQTGKAPPMPVVLSRPTSPAMSQAT